MNNITEDTTPEFSKSDKCNNPTKVVFPDRDTFNHKMIDLECFDVDIYNYVKWLEHKDSLSVHDELKKYRSKLTQDDNDCTYTHMSSTKELQHKKLDIIQSICDIIKNM